MANVTEIHEALDFAPRREGDGRDGGEDDGHWGSFGGWRWLGLWVGLLVKV
jgi:hypothetical protein